MGGRGGWGLIREGGGVLLQNLTSRRGGLIRERGLIRAFTVIICKLTKLTGDVIEV